MDKINDGGPAFPHSFEETSHPRWRESQGMSLRDWFAGQALAGMHASVNGAYSSKNLAEMAYKQADAMILKRSLSARPQGEGE